MQPRLTPFPESPAPHPTLPAPSATSEAFTARWVADKLGRDARSVRKSFAEAGIAPCRRSKDPASGGQEAQRYAAADVLRLFRSPLADLARRRGFAGSEAYLAASDCPTPHDPPKPIDQVPARFLREAKQWRTALAGALARQHHLAPAGELGAFVARQCRAVFKREVAEKTWRKRFDLAVERDRDFQQWQRLDLYVDPAAYADAPPSPESIKLQGLLAPLEETVAALRAAQHPKLEWKARLFDAVFSFWERLCVEHPHPGQQRDVKAALLKWLAKSEPDMARTPRGLRRAFDRKLPRWIEGGRNWEALFDGRDLANKRRSDDHLTRFAADLERIGRESVKRDGFRTLGYQAAYPELSAEWKATFSPDRTPEIVYRAFPTAKVKAVVDDYRSAWRGRMGGPWIRGDASDHEPGDWFVFDDATANSKVQLPRVCAGGRIFRPEGLFAMDRRSHCFLHFLLVEGHYNSEHILRLFKETHDAAGGLPRVGFKLENGVWRSRFVIGDGADRRLHGRPIKFDSALRGFAEFGFGVQPPEEVGEIALNRPDFGLQISHATPGNPRGKAELESGFGMVQNLMRHLPTFVGFNARLDRMDRNQQTVRDFERRVREGKEDPRNEVPTLEEYAGQLAAAIEQYNARPQHGTLEGRSPKDWLDKSRIKTPLRKLDDNMAHLIATHEKTVKITGRGILLKLRGIVHPYADGPIADLIGTDVRCLYNVYHPGVIWVRHPRTRKLIKLEENCLPKTTGYTKTPERAAAVNRRIAAFRAPAKALSGKIRHDVQSSITRDDDATPESRETASDLAVAIREHESGQAITARREPRLLRFAEEIGVEVPTEPDDRERVLRGLERKLARRQSTESLLSQP